MRMRITTGHLVANIRLSIEFWINETQCQTTTSSKDISNACGIQNFSYLINFYKFYYGYGYKIA